MSSTAAAAWSLLFSFAIGGASLDADLPPVICRAEADTSRVGNQGHGPPGLPGILIKDRACERIHQLQGVALISYVNGVALMLGEHGALSEMLELLNWAVSEAESRKILSDTSMARLRYNRAVALQANGQYRQAAEEFFAAASLDTAYQAPKIKLVQLLGEHPLPGLLIEDWANWLLHLGELEAASRLTLTGFSRSEDHQPNCPSFSRVAAKLLMRSHLAGISLSEQFRPTLASQSVCGDPSTRDKLDWVRKIAQEGCPTVVDARSAKDASRPWQSSPDDQAALVEILLAKAEADERDHPEKSSKCLLMAFLSTSDLVSGVQLVTLLHRLSDANERARVFEKVTTLLDNFNPEMDTLIDLIRLHVLLGQEMEALPSLVPAGATSSPTYHYQQALAAHGALPAEERSPIPKVHELLRDHYIKEGEWVLAQHHATEALSGYLGSGRREKQSQLALRSRPSGNEDLFTEIDEDLDSLRTLSQGSSSATVDLHRASEGMGPWAASRDPGTANPLLGGPWAIVPSTEASLPNADNEDLFAEIDRELETLVTLSAGLDSGSEHSRSLLAPSYDNRLNLKCHEHSLRRAIDEIKRLDQLDEDEAEQRARAHVTEVSSISYSDYVRHIAECDAFCGPLIESLIECHAEAISNLGPELIFFERDRHSVRWETQIREIARMAERLQADPSKKVLLIGRGSRIGDLGYNRRLSGQRARAVAGALAAHQVSADRISVLFLGYEPPQISRWMAERYGLDTVWEERGSQFVNQSVLMVAY